MRKQRLSQRPPQFRLDNSHPLAKGLVFAGLGHSTGSNLYIDSSRSKQHGSLENITPDIAYKWSSSIGRFLVELPNGVVPPVQRINFYTTGIKFRTEATFAQWIRVDTTTNGTGLNTLFTGAYSHYPYTDGNLYIGVFSASRNINGYNNSSFDKSKLHHLAITTSPGSGNYKLYQNGNLVTTGTGDASIYPANVPLYLGHSGAGIVLRGAFADTLLYDRVLSTAEILLLADPSNVMLSGLIVPPRRKLFAVPATGGGGDVTVSIGTVSVAATLSDPAVSLTTKTVEIGTISVAATLSDPAVVKTTKTVEIGTVSVATSVSDPAVVLTSKTVEVGAVSVATSLSDPTVVKTTKTVEVGAVSVATSVADPSVSAGGNVAISIGAVSVAVSVSDPAVSTGGSVSIEIGTVSVAGSLSDPIVVKTTKTVDVGAVSVATSVSDPSVTSGGSIAINIGAVNVGLSVSDPEIILGSVTVNDLRMSVALTLSDPLLVSVPIHESRLHRVRYEARIHRIRRS